MMTDPISDMLTRIRNAGLARHLRTTCPSSKMKLAIARLLSNEGFIGDVKVEAVRDASEEEIEHGHVHGAGGHHHD